MMAATVTAMVVADVAPSSSSSGPVLAVGLLGFISFVLWLWALIDVLRRPAYAFERAGVSRTLWLVLLIASVFCGLAGIVAIVYLVFPSSKVRNQVQLGRGPGFPGYP